MRTQETHHGAMYRFWRCADEELERTDGGVVAGSQGDVEGGFAVRGFLRGIGAGAHQKADHGRVVVSGRDHERGHAVLGGGIDVGFALDQLLGEHERRRAARDLVQALLRLQLRRQSP